MVEKNSRIVGDVGYKYIEGRIILAQYTDFDIDFSKNEFTGDLSIKEERAAIQQSVRNIIMTRKNEKPFNPNFGVGLHDLLFDNWGDLTRIILFNDIKVQLFEFEPRVVLDNVILDDSNMDSNELTIGIQYKILKQIDQASSPTDRINIAITKVR